MTPLAFLAWSLLALAFVLFVMDQRTEDVP